MVGLSANYTYQRSFMRNRNPYYHVRDAETLWPRPTHSFLPNTGIISIIRQPRYCRIVLNDRGLILDRYGLE